MKKIFIGQAVTGQDIKSLQKEMKKIYSILKQKGFSVYSTIEEGKSTFKKAGDWVLHAFKKIDNHDIYLAIIRTENRSEWLLMEIGYTISKKKKIILAINERVRNTYLRDFTNHVLEWKNFGDLLNKLSRLKI